MQIKHALRVGGLIALIMATTSVWSQTVATAHPIAVGQTRGIEGKTPSAKSRPAVTTVHATAASAELNLMSAATAELDLLLAAKCELESEHPLTATVNLRSGANNCRGEQLRRRH